CTLAAVPFLAAMMVRQGQTVEALRLFQQAEQAGESAHSYVADRALAYDLVGDNARAQQDYRQALAGGPNAVLTRRLALSQAISGDQAGSDRKSTRLNSSHVKISYAVFCLKKKNAS